MNVLGLAARVVVALALLTALVMSFVPDFLVFSVDYEGNDDLSLPSLSVGASAWHSVGSLGALAVMAGLPIAVVSAALPLDFSVARRVMAAVAGAACLFAAILFGLYLVERMSTIDDGMSGLGLHLGFGWAGIVALAALVVGTVAGALGSLLSDPDAAPTRVNPR